MAGDVLTRDRIIEAAEEVLRRFGPDKTTVVDVARALGVSHGAIYRHFASKEALRAAVTERWLNRVSQPLEAIVEEPGDAAVRLRRWIEALFAFKKKKILADPELFTTYSRLAFEAGDVIEAHVAELLRQIRTIIEQGIDQGRFMPGDAAEMATAVFNAMARFHHPAHAREWARETVNAEFEALWQMVLRGLEARP